MVLGDWLHLLNGQPIPNDGSGHRLKHGIDTWLAAQSQAAPIPSQRVSFMREAPLHLPYSHNSHPPSTHIKVAETHIMQVVDAGLDDSDSDSDNDNLLDFFQVYATERRKRETRRSKLPKLYSSALSAPTIPTSKGPIRR